MGTKFCQPNTLPAPFAVFCWEHARNSRFSTAAFQRSFSRSKVPRDSCSSVSRAGSFLRPGLALRPVLLNLVGPVVGGGSPTGSSVQSGNHSWRGHLVPRSSPSSGGVSTPCYVLGASISALNSHEYSDVYFPYLPCVLTPCPKGPAPLQLPQVHSNC